MDYILHYTGTVPKYVDVCIDTIKKIDPESNITFLNNSDFQNENALSINTKDISDQYLENFLNINFVIIYGISYWNFHEVLYSAV